jgi:hypothetical protein
MPLDIGEHDHGGGGKHNPENIITLAEATLKSALMVGEAAEVCPTCLMKTIAGMAFAQFGGNVFLNLPNEVTKERHMEVIMNFYDKEFRGIVMMLLESAVDVADHVKNTS